jgi:mRNA interferase MazF
MVSRETFVPDRGDLIWLDFHPQAGREQTGRRPGLVLSPGSYHARVGLALVCPVTSRVKGYPFEVLLPEGAAICGAVLADHVRSVDWRQRRAEPVGKASPDLLEAVTQRVEALIRPEDRAR